MGFKKFLDGVKDKYDQRHERKQKEEEKLKEYKKTVNGLLGRFEIPDLDDFFMKYLNDKPESEIEEEEDGRKIEQRPSRREYIDFAWDYLDDEDITYEQLKNFALKKRIVSPSFFRTVDDSVDDNSDFEVIINSIKSNFEPEAITNEEHLEAQLTIFLKAKFPEKKIRRQVTIQRNDVLDILVDDKYAFELKVPRARADLRNLGSQLEEYLEQYPQLCVVIFDVNESNLTQDIIDYSNKYKQSYGIVSVILGGIKRI